MLYVSWRRKIIADKDGFPLPIYHLHKPEGDRIYHVAVVAIKETFQKNGYFSGKIRTGRGQQ